MPDTPPQLPHPLAPRETTGKGSPGQNSTGQGSFAPGPNGQDPTAQGAAKKRGWLPWALGCGCAALVLLLAVIIALAFWLVPAMLDDSDAPAGGAAGPQAPADTHEVSTEVMSFTFPQRWEETDLSQVHNVVIDGSTQYEFRTWSWKENPSDPMPREIATYRYWGPDSTPRTTKADPARITSIVEQSKTKLAAATSQELQYELSRVGHSCVSETALLTEPEDVKVSGLTGYWFSYECVGSETGHLGIRGIFAVYVDNNGNYHELTISTDHENFDKKREEFEAIAKNPELI